MLAGVASGVIDRDTNWLNVVGTVEPNPHNTVLYDDLYAMYRSMHTQTVDIQHQLAALQAK